MLTFLEEILLIALDDDSGRLFELPKGVLEYALAGAMMMELAFQHRLDSDMTNLTIVNPAPTGDPLLDENLQLLAGEGTIPIREGLRKIVANAETIKQQTFQSLVDKNILRREETRYFWGYKTRRYPIVDDKEDREVRSRIRGVVLEDDFPGPRDVVLICLMDACQLGGTILSPQELETAAARIQLVAKLDLIGQAISKNIVEIRQALIEALRFSKI